MIDIVVFDGIVRRAREGAMKSRCGRALAVIGFSGLVVGRLAAAEPSGASAPTRPSMAELEAKQKTALQHFAPLFGIWRGTTVETRPGGSQVKTIAAHRVGPMLGGEAVELEGRSYNQDGTIAFDLMAIISYDPGNDKYAFRAYGRGHIVTAVLHLTPTGYSFDRADPTGAPLRYTVVFGDGHWREHGARVMPGGLGSTVLDTDMSRVGSTDWPAGNPVEFKRP